MSLTLMTAVAAGLVVGGFVLVLDRRFARHFAETSGDSLTSAQFSPVLAICLVASLIAAYSLLSVRESIGMGTVYRGVFVAVLVWIASIDWRWRIIPNRLVYPSTVMALALCPIAQPGPLSLAYRSALVGLFVAGGLFLFFFLLSVLIYHRPGAFGLGDVKLAGFVGAALGFPSALAAVILATFAGALLALAWGVISRNRKAGFPYGPAIVVGAVLAMLIAPNGGSF